MDIIRVHNLEKIYKNEEVETRALDGLSFTIAAGEFVAIMGRSGSGKSTLVHILGFLDEVTGGHYFFDGKDASTYDEDEKSAIRNAKMGFIFQAFNLLPRTSVLDNVKLPLMYSGVPESQWDAKAKSAIELVGLSHRANHSPSQLSGGEKQRVAIARALINNPKVIFADEPTGNLDSKSGEVVIDTLQKLNDEGHTIILVTHETYTAEHAKRMLVLEDGKLLTDKLLEQRRHAKGGMLK